MKILLYATVDNCRRGNRKLRIVDTIYIRRQKEEINTWHRIYSTTSQSPRPFCPISSCRIPCIFQVRRCTVRIRMFLIVMLTRGDNYFCEFNVLCMLYMYGILCTLYVNVLFMFTKKHKHALSLVELRVFVGVTETAVYRFVYFS